MKKVFQSTGLAKREREISKYMDEVTEIGRAGLSRRELLKMGVAAGAGGLTLGLSKSTQAAIIDPQVNPFVSPQVLNPWTENLYIPPTVHRIDPNNGLYPAPVPIPGATPSNFTIAELAARNPSSWGGQTVTDPSGQPLMRYSEARKEEHQRWSESYPSAKAYSSAPVGSTAGPLKPLKPDNAHHYLLLAREVPYCFYPHADGVGNHCHVWTFCDGSDPKSYAGEYSTYEAGVRVAPLRLVARYGQPTYMRVVNMLPADNRGFGINKISTHLHNHHNAPPSDGGPLRWFEGWNTTNNTAQFWDYHYPNIRAGFTGSTYKTSIYKPYPSYPTGYTDPKTGIVDNRPWQTCAGNFAETLSTLWFHDHKMDFTAQNVYKGLASFYTLYSDDINLDYGDADPEDPTAGGDETKGLGLPCGKNFEFDIPLVFADKMFNPSGGELFMDILNFDGFLGDMTTVNFQIKPKLEVKKRKYRFRMLVGGPSRFFQFHLSVDRAGTMVDIPYAFWRISTDGNLLVKPINQTCFRLGVAERVDVIIDFANLKDANGFSVNEGDTLWLENRLHQINGRGPSGKVLPANEATKILKIKVNPLPVGEVDRSVIPPLPSVTRPIPMLAMPALPAQEAKKIAVSRTWDFGSSNGAWSVNGKLFDPAVISAQIKPNTWEQWTITSGGGWAHPIHIHHEEFQIVSRDNTKYPSGIPTEEISRKDVLRIGDAALINPSPTALEGASINSGKVVIQMQFRDWWGDYPMHCHNVVHEDHGMMIRFEILK